MSKNRQPLLIVDGHLDLAYNALFHRRDLTQPVQILREREDPGGSKSPAHPDSIRERRRPKSSGPGVATVSLPELRKGRVGIAFATVMSRVQIPNEVLDDGVRTQTATYAIGQSHLHYYKALEAQGEVTLIKNLDSLEHCAKSWRNREPNQPLGLILSMESADPILGPDQVQEWWEAGVRSVGLTHFGANTWGHGTGTRGGLYPCAYPLLDALQEAGVVLDLTHASDMTFWQLLDYWKGPLHASHCMCRVLVPGQRHLSDEMIKAVTDRGGVIGMVFAEPMLNPAWNFDDAASFQPVAERTMSAVVDHIEHICSLTGNSDHVAIGSDLDGGFGREWAPTDYDTIDDLQTFLDIVERRGFKQEDVAKIAHGNLLRLLRNAWSETS